MIFADADITGGFEEWMWPVAVAVVGVVVWTVVASRRWNRMRMDVMRHEFRRFYGLPEEDAT